MSDEKIKAIRNLTQNYLKTFLPSQCISSEPVYYNLHFVSFLCVV
jgi:hypothetical protein